MTSEKHVLDRCERMQALAKHPRGVFPTSKKEQQTTALLYKSHRQDSVVAIWEAMGGKWAHNGGGGEEQREHGGHELVEADAHSAREKCSTAAQVHCAHLPSQQTDAHDSQRPACDCIIITKKEATDPQMGLCRNTLHAIINYSKGSDGSSDGHMWKS